MIYVISKDWLQVVLLVSKHKFLQPYFGLVFSMYYPKFHHRDAVKTSAKRSELKNYSLNLIPINLVNFMS